jgi:hypothetical protein
MIERIKNEPAMFFAIVRQAISLAVAFGLQLTEPQTLALGAFVEMVTAFMTRAAVTPNGLAEHRVLMGNSPTTPLTPAQEAANPRS